MRNIILFDDETRDNLLPLTFTRPVSELRVGILTIREKWEKLLEGRVSHITLEYLTARFPINIEKDNLIINAAVLPNERLVKLISELKPNEALVREGELVAASIPGSEFDALIDGSFGEEIAGYNLKETEVAKLSRLWDLFELCGAEIIRDYEWMADGRTSAELSKTNNTIGDYPVFLEEGVVAEYVTFNTTNGPIYIGADSLVMEGSIIRGPAAFGRGCVVKLGTRIYGPCSFGPFCKIGGELNNVVMQGYSNKGHDGFLGNAVLGEWCNIGADTNCSNLKNTYSEVKVWNYALEAFEQSGRLFCGLIMGDHAKCGINTMFNTGTVVGVGANVFGAGYPPKFIPSFTWGGISDTEEFVLEKALSTAAAMMRRRNVDLSEQDEDILTAVFEATGKYRMSPER